MSNSWPPDVSVEDADRGVVHRGDDGRWWAYVVPNSGWPMLIDVYATRVEATKAVVDYRKFREEHSS